MSLNIKDNSKNLGDIKINQPIQFQNTLKNDTDKVITITNVTPACGSCTTSRVEKSILLPNDSTQIISTFTPSSTGYNNKNVTIYFKNDNNTASSITLYFSANVIN